MQISGIILASLIIPEACIYAYMLTLYLGTVMVMWVQ
jgi:hypothetical protein